MVFFGRKGKVVPGEVVEGMQCPSCDNSSFVSFGLIKYFHLYWIPTFLTGKQAGVECTHCKKTMIGDELPEALSAQLKSTLFTPQRTLPMYTGLVLLAIVFAFGAHWIQQSDAEQTAYIEQPLARDMYIVRLDKIFTEQDTSYPYGLMRIVGATGDMYEIQIANMVYNKAKGVRKDISSGKALDDAYYGEDVIQFSHAELKEMNETGAIYSVKRP